MKEESPARWAGGAAAPAPAVLRRPAVRVRGPCQRLNTALQSPRGGLATAASGWRGAKGRPNWTHGYQHRRADALPGELLLHQFFSFPQRQSDAGFFGVRLPREPGSPDVYALENLVGDRGLDGGGGAHRRAVRLYRAQDDLRAAMVPAQLRRAAA